MLKFFIHLLFAIKGIHTAFSGQWLMKSPRYGSVSSLYFIQFLNLQQTLIHHNGDYAMQLHF
ncbi:MAG TPA: hypothetical protein DDY75_02255 [Sphingobacterium sp.]|nr:hypothetical protein HMPREF3127_11240 [Sphingobacterium sp. HMSC13C05]OJZ12361.1 MAG: hypothetical protein BGP15_21540 [Sphingobacterium sp. 40-24]HAF33437.1 hypothetical protein [Sphingobacterium sp.]HAL50830.1 hypothetical protein [Sphingobacterium sp.]HBI86705.1 hypothetical protein [Sphingobacterium sp.]